MQQVEQEWECNEMGRMQCARMMSQPARNDKKKNKEKKKHKEINATMQIRKHKNNNVMSNDLTQDKTQKTIKKTPLDEGGFLMFMTKCKAQVAIAWCY